MPLDLSLPVRTRSGKMVKELGVATTGYLTGAVYELRRLGQWERMTWHRGGEVLMGMEDALDLVNVAKEGESERQLLLDLMNEIAQRQSTVWLTPEERAFATRVLQFLAGDYRALEYMAGRRREAPLQYYVPNAHPWQLRPLEEVRAEGLDPYASR